MRGEIWTLYRSLEHSLQHLKFLNSKHKEDLQNLITWGNPKGFVIRKKQEIIDRLDLEIDNIQITLNKLMSKYDFLLPGPLKQKQPSKVKKINAIFRKYGPLSKSLRDSNLRTQILVDLKKLRDENRI